VKGNGALTCEVLPNQIEFRFGDDNSGLHLFLNYRGFAKFMTVASNVVKRLRAIPHGAPIDFTVPITRTATMSAAEQNGT